MQRIRKAVAMAVIVAVTAFAFVLQGQRLGRAKAEAERLRTNNEVLQGEARKYKVSDSLSGARVQALTLTLDEYKRYRAEDTRLLEEAKKKLRALERATTTQAETIIELSARGRDTLIITRDSIEVPALAFHCGDPWYDFDGILTGRDIQGTLVSRDSLLLAESVRYRRFLGFLWKTSKVRERSLDVVSRNPHTEILGIDFVVLEK